LYIDVKPYDWSAVRIKLNKKRSKGILTKCSIINIVEDLRLKLTIYVYIELPDEI